MQLQRLSQFIPFIAWLQLTFKLSRRKDKIIQLINSGNKRLFKAIYQFRVREKREGGGGCQSV